MTRGIFASGWQIPACDCPGHVPHPDATTAAASQYTALFLLSITVVLLAYHGARFVMVTYRRLCCCKPMLAASEDDVSESGSGATEQNAEEEARMARAVHRAMESQRLERMRSAAVVMANVFPVFLLLQFVLYGGHLWSDLDLTADREMWRQVPVPMLFGALVMTIWQAAPSLVTSLSVDIVHALMYLFFFAATTMFKNNEIEFLHSSMWTTCTRIGTAVIAGNFRLVCASEGCYSAARILFFYTALNLDSFFSYTFGELWVCAAVIIICRLVESSRQAEMKSTVEARNSSQAESTVYSLLAAMCDAVVHVGNEHQIERPAPKLALLLFMQNAVKNLMGSNLTDFMTDADKTRFRATAEDLKATARSLNVHLRDAFGALVGVRLFLARCPPNEDGEVCQLVGISVDREPGVDHVPEGNDTAVMSPNVQEIAVHSAHRASGRSARSSRSGASEESLPLQSAEENEVAVWLEPESDDDLTVLACTVAFTFVSGPASSGSFSLLKAVGNRDRFLNWFQHCYNAKFNHQVLGTDVNNEHAQVEPFDMILLPQKSCQKIIGLTATCTFTSLTVQDEKVVVKLNFHDLREVSVSRKATSTSRKGRVRDALASELPCPSGAEASKSFATVCL